MVISCCIGINDVSVEMTWLLFLQDFREYFERVDGMSRQRDKTQISNIESLS